MAQLTLNAKASSYGGPRDSQGNRVHDPIIVDGKPCRPTLGLDTIAFKTPDFVGYPFENTQRIVLAVAIVVVEGVEAGRERSELSNDVPRQRTESIVGKGCVQNYGSFAECMLCRNDQEGGCGQDLRYGCDWLHDKDSGNSWLTPRRIIRAEVIMDDGNVLSNCNN